MSPATTGRVTASLFSAALLRMQARVRGDRGELYVLNPFAPQFFHRVKVRTPEGSRVERVRSEPTYTHQLRAFVRAVRGEEPIATDARHGIANMRVIDAVYRAAGLAPRGSSAAA